MVQTGATPGPSKLAKVPPALFAGALMLIGVIVFAAFFLSGKAGIDSGPTGTGPAPAQMAAPPVVNVDTSIFMQTRPEAEIPVGPDPAMMAQIAALNDQVAQARQRNEALEAEMESLRNQPLPEMSVIPPPAPMTQRDQRPATFGSSSSRVQFTDRLPVAPFNTGTWIRGTLVSGVSVGPQMEAPVVIQVGSVKFLGTAKADEISNRVYVKVETYVDTVGQRYQMSGDLYDGKQVLGLVTSVYTNDAGRIIAQTIAGGVEGAAGAIRENNRDVVITDYGAIPRENPGTVAIEGAARSASQGVSGMLNQIPRRVVISVSASQAVYVLVR